MIAEYRVGERVQFRTPDGVLIEGTVIACYGSYNSERGTWDVRYEIAAVGASGNSYEFNAVSEDAVLRRV